MRRRVDPTMVQLMVDVSAGLRVLQTRDGVRLTESQIRERTRNIVMGLLGNYRIEAFAREGRAELDRGTTGEADENDSESLRAPGHSPDAG